MNFPFPKIYEWKPLTLYSFVFRNVEQKFEMKWHIWIVWSELLLGFQFKAILTLHPYVEWGIFLRNSVMREQFHLAMKGHVLAITVPFFSDWKKQLEKLMAKYPPMHIKYKR